jgi:hypothetical protein
MSVDGIVDLHEELGVGLQASDSRYSFLLEEAVVRSLPYLGRSVLWKDPDRVPVGGVPLTSNGDV